MEPVKNQESAENAVVEAIRDLTRVLLVTSGRFESKTDMILALRELLNSPTRIAKLVGMQPKDVTSILSRAKKAGKKRRSSKRRAAPASSS